MNAKKACEDRRETMSRSISLETNPNESVVDIHIREEMGWHRHRAAPVELWFKGWIHGHDAQSIAEWFRGKGQDICASEVGEFLASLQGHFSIAVRGTDWGIAAVDWVRSIPLAMVKVDGDWAVDDQADRLRRRAGLGAADVDRASALEIAMAGYTVDVSSLYRGLTLLGPGELMMFRREEAPERHRYFIYRPWQAASSDDSTISRRLEELTLEIMEKTLESISGRPLIVPLSAGNDSRLIVSAARHLGYRDVRCFSYGRVGNFEADVARTIAERLGYDWRFVPCTTGRVRSFFASNSFEEYLRFADSCSSTPFVQDMFVAETLKQDGYIPPDAVFANGNSGDFISGGHIAPSLHRPEQGGDVESCRGRILDALYEKHFGLWGVLRTVSNKARITNRLSASLERAEAKVEDCENSFGLYEFAEFQDRQCKYVITGQRIYEFLGHEWRLPLWDNAYLAFWERVSLASKAGQTLYTRMLQDANWGGVWRDIPVNRLNIRPHWLRPLRFLAKGVFAPFGRENWHQFERQYLQYWMDVTCNSACVPYSKVAGDRRGSRHSVSWLAERYLARHDVSIDEFGLE